MDYLRYGSTGPAVQLLQLALDRAGYQPGALDGIFGQKTRRAVLAFQSAQGLRADGVLGPMTNAAIMPWYTGFLTHTVVRGDSLYRIARRYGSTLAAIETANPGLDPLNLQIGSALVVPLPFEVVPTNINYSSRLVAYLVRGLSARYPFLRVGEFGNSVMGRPLYSITIGRGARRVLYNAEHHANEWITTPLLFKFIEDLAAAFVKGESLAGIDAARIYELAEICLIPAMNPDGMDLVTGALTGGRWFERAAAIAEQYPDIAFPQGWKANVSGVDLNLQYPAGWEQAREIKFAQGITGPAPRDYVGASPLSAPESRALYQLTLGLDPEATLSYHTQGNVIYWKYLNLEPEGSRALAERLGALSGYAVENTPFASGFAGFKDWFILSYDRPGYTIEAGQGTNPLPIEAFPEIYARNLGILAETAVYGLIP